MNRAFRQRSIFLAESAGLDLPLAIDLMRSAHADKKSLHDFIRDMGRFSEGRRKKLFRLAWAIRCGYNVFAEASASS